jgi:thymidylate kinase
MIATRRRYFEVFEELRDRDNIVLVDADRPPEEVAEDVFAAAEKILE